MSTYLYAYPALLVFTEQSPMPGYMVFDQEVSGQYVYLSARQLDYPSQTLVGAWNGDGSIMLDSNDNPIPIDPLFDSMRPVGNIEGVATGPIKYHYFLGHLPRYVQAVPVVDTDPVYPADNQPMVLTMARRWDDTLGFEGWGWIATIEFADPNRSPDARAVGIYDTDWNYLYTTGAFVWTDTGEVDGDGNPIYKWQTLSPAGQATATKEVINYAMLFGATQEGRGTLIETKDSQELYFWEHDQVIPGESWQDSGATVTGMAGTVTLVSDVAPFAVGNLVRIEGVEMSVTSIWSGQGLVLDPYRTSTTGATIEIWQ